MLSMVLGMLGAALALGLFSAGYGCGRRGQREPKREGRKAPPMNVAAEKAAAERAAAWREYWNFLHYDGSEMPDGKEERR